MSVFHSLIPKLQPSLTIGHSISRLSQYFLDFLPLLYGSIVVPETGLEPTHP
ncbi:MAG: hypothetical protein GYA75_08520 [Bacteroidales bacterium]|nr:hypothetical protein [Bacteroidales bacterium]